ncbi:hypothetical protein [Pseudobutyrivibrio ruminis]|uniref:tRNA_anti-like n=1 Tax=Pseudobutyrivibrio ruminis DSM 9787 TaxID=1123011 RepID=A0A285SKJ1_9FIRM|nr:hypothetical protein [Pseudobutyrivibrio ruminis]SOC08448.1 hypothetical protein SAMN02910411_2488 [Pseudobutyrivibrio ruminis DSM 9787]
MYKKVNILLGLLMALVFVGCGSTEAASVQETEVAEEQVAEEPEVEVEDSESLENELLLEDENVDADPGVDLDLTALSSTMVYSEVFNMMMAPEEYEGKTIKMDGVCNVYQDSETGKTYYACIVQDATQCCSQGLEFVLDESQYEASDYPENGDEIVISGDFSTYTEGDYQYITILNSVLE